MMSQLATNTAPRLFISYSHDSREHEDRVLALADRLRQDGVDAVVDQFDKAPSDGWPMWMDREIRRADFVAMVCTETYLRRVEGRESSGKGRGVLWEAMLIYNSLYLEDFKVQRFIPILFEDGVPSCIPLPVRGLTHYRVDSQQGYEDFYRHLTNQPRNERHALGMLRALSTMAPQSYPASLEFRTEPKTRKGLDQRNRLRMLKNVRSNWIDGVLKQSLYQIGRIELGLQTKPDAVVRPWKAVVQTPDQPTFAVPIGTSISQIFDDHSEALLILGAPGTGKTTLLLELAQDLLDRAERDETHPIPVVFNLSSWPVRRLTLDRWLVAELNERDDVPKRIAQRWVAAEQILPLLDGLDEVAVEHRQECGEAINNFRRDHGLLPIVVCSRIADYKALGTKLRLRTAVEVQPLTRAEVNGYLEQIGDRGRTLRAALKQDLSFLELLETPLMLWVAMLAYQNAPVGFSSEDSFEQQSRLLFANFVDAMFNRRSAETRYTQQESISSLCWLASALKRNGQTIFYLDSLSEAWLPTKTQKWLSWVGTVVACGIFCGLIGALIGVAMSGLSDWAYGLIFGLIPGIVIGLVIGLMFVLIIPLAKPRPFGVAQLRLADMRSQGPKAMRVGFGSGLVFGVMFLVLVGWVASLLATLAAALIGGLLTLIEPAAVETGIKPSAGIRTWIKSAFFAFLGSGLIAALMSWMISMLLGERNRLFSGLTSHLTFGMFVGLFMGLGGVLIVLRHGVLRLVLWISTLAPLKCTPFLDYAAERLFLRKVGSGYIFLHRMLLEYFATLAAPPGQGQIAGTYVEAIARSPDMKWKSFLEVLTKIGIKIQLAGWLVAIVAVSIVQEISPNNTRALLSGGAVGIPLIFVGLQLYLRSRYPQYRSSYPEVDLGRGFAIMLLFSALFMLLLILKTVWLIEMRGK
jgi:DNA polymerase III delta prime subunit